MGVDHGGFNALVSEQFLHLADVYALHQQVSDKAVAIATSVSFADQKDALALELVDFPVWMIQSLDKEASCLGVPRQSLIKVLVFEHIQKAHA